MYLEIVFDDQTRLFSVAYAGPSPFSLSVDDANNVAEVFKELSENPQDCCAARVWLDCLGKGRGYVDYR